MIIIIKINFIQFLAIHHWIMNKASPVWKQVILYETQSGGNGAVLACTFTWHSNNRIIASIRPTAIGATWPRHADNWR